MALPRRDRLDPTRDRSRDLRRILWVVLLVNVAIRAAYLCTFPLLITNDSVGYLRWAGEVLDGHALTITRYRTPGYSLWLAGIIGTFGRGPGPILFAQHALATIATLAVAAASYRLAGRRAALVAGVGLSLDPYLLMFGSFALSESVTISLVCIAVAAAISPKRPIAAVVVVALAAGAATLCRPAIQILLPFLVGACVLAPAISLRRRVVVGAVGCAVTLAVLLPWLLFNARRDVPGLAAGTGAILFSNLARVGVPRAEHAPDPALAEPFAPFEGRVLTEPEMWTYLQGVGALSSETTDAGLSRWAMRTITEDPGGYAVRAARACVWQLNVFPGAWNHRNSELNWMLTRLGTDGTARGQAAPNFQVGALTADDAHLLAPFEGHARQGPFLRTYIWIAQRWPRGLPQVVLVVCALVAGWLAFTRRQWPLLAVLGGTLAFVVFHGLLVFPFARYSLPAVAVWYAAAGQVVAAGLAGSRRDPSAIRRDPAPLT